MATPLVVATEVVKEEDSVADPVAVLNDTTTILIFNKRAKEVVVTMIDMATCRVVVEVDTITIETSHLMPTSIMTMT